MVKPKRQPNRRLCYKVEALAQRLYHLRDVVPVGDTKTWGELDEHAAELSRIAGRLKNEDR